MEILRYSLGSLQANCYLLIEENECLIIDPADEASFILTELQRRRLRLAGMLATHGHFDHIMAAGEIQLSFKIPLQIFKEDLFLVERPNETAKYFLGFDPNSLKPKDLKFIKEGELKTGDFKMKTIHTPGHTPGSACFYFPKSKTLFTGDTLFKDGIGSYDHSYSNKKELFSSVSKILKMPGETTVYPGHGERTTISQEK